MRRVFEVVISYRSRAILRGTFDELEEAIRRFDDVSHGFLYSLIEETDIYGGTYWRVTAGWEFYNGKWYWKMLHGGDGSSRLVTGPGSTTLVQSNERNLHLSTGAPDV